MVASLIFQCTVFCVCVCVKSLSEFILASMQISVWLPSPVLLAFGQTEFSNVPFTLDIFSKMCSFKYYSVKVPLDLVARRPGL